MERIERLQKAKLYLDELAYSMDPTTQEFVENEILQKEEIKDVLAFVSTVLEEVIENDGKVSKACKPIRFQASKVNKQAVVLSDELVPLPTLMSRINQQVEVKPMRKLRASKIFKWLIRQKYLVREGDLWIVTEKAENLGIVLDNKKDEITRDIKPYVFLTRNAQEYIVENLETILEIAAKKGERNDLPARRKPTRGGQLWSKEEDDALKREYAEEMLSVSKIAELHGRTKAGIKARLRMFALIE